MRLKIEEQALQTMHSHAQDTFPNECCGFMYGHENDVRTVTEARLVDNSKEGDQRRRFEISGKDYMDAEKYALEKGMTLLGVYHSHPQHPAIPSEHDRKQALPWFSYTIVSVMDGKVDHTRSWQLDETKQFTEEELKP